MKPSQLKVPEKDIQASILDYLRARQIFCWKEHAGVIPAGDGKFRKAGLVGKSDILGILPGGRFLAIEVKRVGGKATPEQLYFLREIERHGGVSFIAHSLDEVIARFATLRL